MMKIECTDIILLAVIVLYSIRAICIIVEHDKMKMRRNFYENDRD